MFKINSLTSSHIFRHWLIVKNGLPKSAFFSDNIYVRNSSGMVNQEIKDRLNLNTIKIYNLERKLLIHALRNSDEFYNDCFSHVDSDSIVFVHNGIYLDSCSHWKLITCYEVGNILTPPIYELTKAWRKKSVLNSNAMHLRNDIDNLLLQFDCINNTQLLYLVSQLKYINFNSEFVTSEIENISKLIKYADQVCCQRATKWNVDFLTKVWFHYSQTSLKEIGFNETLFQLLIKDNYKNTTRHHLTLLLFLMDERKMNDKKFLAPNSEEFMNTLQGLYKKLNFAELSVLSRCLLHIYDDNYRANLIHCGLWEKFRLHIVDELIFYCNDKFMQTKYKFSEHIVLMCLLKFLTKRHGTKYLEVNDSKTFLDGSHIYKMFDSFLPLFKKWSRNGTFDSEKYFLGIVMLRVGAETHYGVHHKEFTQLIVDYMRENLHCFRLKDISNALSSLVGGNFSDKNSPTIYELIQKELHSSNPKRLVDIKYHPYYALDIVTQLCLMGIIDRTWIEQIFSVVSKTDIFSFHDKWEFNRMFYKNFKNLEILKNCEDYYSDKNKVKYFKNSLETYSMLKSSFHRLAFLDAVLDIECPNYTGIKLTPEEKIFLVKCDLSKGTNVYFSDAKKIINSSKKLKSRDGIIMSVHKKLKITFDLNNDENFLEILHPLIHFGAGPDIIFAVKNGKLMNISDYVEALRSHAIISVDQSLADWFCIHVIIRANMNSDLSLRRQYLHKLKHLRLLGFNTIGIEFYNWQSDHSDFKKNSYLQSTLLKVFQNKKHCTDLVQKLSVMPQDTNEKIINPSTVLSSLKKLNSHLLPGQISSFKVMETLSKSKKYHSCVDSLPNI